MENRQTSCPCCGYNTIGERAQYEICQICWWEDDGQDNEDDDFVRGGPNSNLSLTQARKNFILCGKFDPKRTDLKSASTEDYQRKRFFKITAAEIVVEESSRVH